MKPGAPDLAYRILSGDDSDERACRAIPESACTDLPRNYVLNVLNGSATKLAEKLADPGLVLPWLLSAVGAPQVFATLLAPIKQAGSLAPQLLVAGFIRKLEIRKLVWVSAGIVQAAFLILIAVAALSLPPVLAGAAVALLFLLFSIASGCGSVAFQDVMGKTIPQGVRGRLLGNRAMIGGLLTLIAAVGLRFGAKDQPSLWLVTLLIIFSANLWMLGSLFFALMREERGATSGGRNLIDHLRDGWQLMGRYPAFRRFNWARAFLLSVEISLPFFALHAYGLFGNSAQTLLLFIFSIGLADIVSSPFWGAFSDRSSRSVMALSGVLAGAAAGLAIGLPPTFFDGASAYAYAPVFLLIGVAQSGVRLGRKTYLVDAAPEGERPLMVALSNTLTGIVALAAGLLGLLNDAFAPAVGLGAIGLLAVIGAAITLRLPPATEMAHKS